MTNYREILRLNNLGINNTRIAESCGCSRTTVVNTLRRAKECGLRYPLKENMSDKELSDLLFPSSAEKPAYKMPDYEYVHREMAKSGEIIEVDWAGDTAHIIDTDTRGFIDVNAFVASLPYSGYSYVEAFMDRSQESWTTAHVNAFNYFGGVARILVPDNLKTGVNKVSRAETIINKSYQGLSEHYGTAVIPRRVRAPKDKLLLRGRSASSPLGLLRHSEINSFCPYTS